MRPEIFSVTGVFFRSRKITDGHGVETKGAALITLIKVPPFSDCSQEGQSGVSVVRLINLLMSACYIVEKAQQQKM